MKARLAKGGNNYINEKTEHTHIISFNDFSKTALLFDLQRNGSKLDCTFV